MRIVFRKHEGRKATFKTYLDVKRTLKWIWEQLGLNMWIMATMWI